MAILATLELTHAAWLGLGPLRLVADAIDHTLMVDGMPVLFVADPALSFATLAKDDTGRVSTPLVLGNEDNALLDRFRLLRGDAERPAATLRWYDDETLVLGPVPLEMHAPRATGAVIRAELRSQNDEDKPAHPMSYTLENTPTLRGLQ